MIGMDCPAGTEVIITDDHRRRWNTRTRSQPWALGSGDVVVLVEGIAGGYLVERITVGHDPQLGHFRDRNRQPPASDFGGMP